MLKNRIVYGVMLLGAIVTSYYYNSFVLDALLYALLTILPLSLLSIIISLVTIQFDLVLEKTEYKKKEQGNMTIQIRNVGALLISNVAFLPFHDFGIYMEDTKVKVPIINGKETFFFQVDFHADYRGAYRLGVKNIYISDYFKLFKIKIKKEKSVEVIYYPDLILSHYKGSYSAISDEENINGIDFVEQDVLVDIRNYEYGDPLKKIHWKLSAKNNEFLVKKYSSNKEKKAALIIDTKALPSLRPITRLLVEDQIMEYAVAIIYASINSNTEIRVVSSVNENQDLKHIEEFPSIYKHLAKYDFDHDQTIEESLSAYFKENEEKQLSDTNHIFIITNQPSKELYGLIVEHKYGNHSFHVYCLLYNSQGQDYELKALIKRMDQAGIHVNEIWI